MEYGCGSFVKRGSSFWYVYTLTRQHSSEVACSQPLYVREHADLRVCDGLRESTDLPYGAMELILDSANQGSHQRTDTGFYRAL